MKIDSEICFVFFFGKIPWRILRQLAESVIDDTDVGVSWREGSVRLK